jgi:hypothetical protein
VGLILILGGLCGVASKSPVWIFLAVFEIEGKTEEEIG